MASGEVKSCEICMNTFKGPDRKAVALPCGHDFCLTCLVRLKTAGSHKCPKCRGDWAELEVQALAGMALGAAAQEEEGELLEKWTKEDYRCRKHEIYYDFWSIKEKMFRCKKCIFEIGLKTSELQLIEDAVPIIKSDIAAKYVGANERMEEDIESIDHFHDEFSEKFKHVSDFRRKIQQLEEKLQGSLQIAEVLRSKRLEDSVLAKKVDDEREKIKSEADIARMVSSMATLETLAQPCRLPALLGPESLLCNIACTYMESEEELPSSTAVIINGLLKATVNSALPLTKAVLDADELKDDEEWLVQNSNCLAALLALADRQPCRLRLSSRHDQAEPLPAAAAVAVAKAAMDCEVWLELNHSFFKPETHNTDRKLLEHILDISSLSLNKFFGHLDAAGIAKLPTTITELGLAIGSATDATAVSGLKPWEELEHLHVSVSSQVVACGLSQLPSDRILLYLHFPDLTDASVDSVRLAIEALVPDLEFRYLALPLSQLTAAGTLRLVQQLRGARIKNVTIDPCGLWRPGKVEMERIEEELRSAVGCSYIDWDMDWLYEASQSSV